MDALTTAIDFNRGLAALAADPEVSGGASPAVLGWPRSAEPLHPGYPSRG